MTLVLAVFFLRAGAPFPMLWNLLQLIGVDGFVLHLLECVMPALCVSVSTVWVIVAAVGCIVPVCCAP